MEELLRCQQTARSTGQAARCARDGAARPGARLHHEIQVDSGRIDQFDQVNRLHDVLREVLHVGDNILTFDRHMIDISQIAKWHMPKWKVAYTRMVSGICQIGKWHIPEWKVVYTRMESGIY